jgi:hypothetical protein
LQLLIRTWSFVCQSISFVYLGVLRG